MELTPEFKRLCWCLYWAQRRTEFGHQRSPRYDTRGWRPFSALNHGWRLIGKGAYASVFAHPDYPDLVMKISAPYMTRGYSKTYSGRASMDPDNWQLFARLCRDEPAEHLPEILWYEQVTEYYAFAVMPRYYAAETHKSEEFGSWVGAAISGEGACPRWLWAVKRLYDNNRMCVDLHSGNVMQSREGTLILTDPFS